MTNPFKNLQAAARRRGLTLAKLDRIHEIHQFTMYGRDGKRMFFEDLAEVRDELRARPTC
jgi:hypothetical protein